MFVSDGWNITTNRDERTGESDQVSGLPPWITWKECVAR